MGTGVQLERIQSAREEKMELEDVVGGLSQVSDTRNVDVA